MQLIYSVGAPEEGLSSGCRPTVRPAIRDQPSLARVRGFDGQRDD
ncbi:MAG: hypothetical protein WAW52_06160 [Methanothrix sp.]